MYSTVLHFFYKKATHLRFDLTPKSALHMIDICFEISNLWCDMFNSTSSPLMVLVQIIQQDCMSWDLQTVAIITTIPKGTTVKPGSKERLDSELSGISEFSCFPKIYFQHKSPAYKGYNENLRLDQNFAITKKSQSLP